MNRFDFWLADRHSRVEKTKTPILDGCNEASSDTSVFSKSSEGPIDYLMRLLVLEIALSESN